jgi:hypothetical protein
MDDGYMLTEATGAGARFEREGSTQRFAMTLPLWQVLLRFATAHEAQHSSQVVDQARSIPLGTERAFAFRKSNRLPNLVATGLSITSRSGGSSRAVRCSSGARDRQGDDEAGSAGPVPSSCTGPPCAAAAQRVIGSRARRQPPAVGFCRVEWLLVGGGPERQSPVHLDYAPVRRGPRAREGRRAPARAIATSAPPGLR